MLKSILLFLLLIILIPAFAQNLTEGITLSVDKDPTYDQKKIISSILKITNTTTEDFQGYIALGLPNGLKALSGDSIRISVPRGEKTFVPVRLIETGTAAAGKATVSIKLLTNNKSILRQQNTTVLIKDNNNLSLITDTPTILVTNSSDSIKISVTVSNNGNKNQFVTIVFGLPDQNGQRYFIERQKMISVKESQTFQISVIPTSYILNHSSVPIHVTAFRGTQKDLIDNSLITIQSVVSNRKYTNPEDFTSFQGSEITTVFRQVGSFANSIQILGNGKIDLPDGNLAIKANVYKTNTQNEFIASNTAVSYHLHENKLVLGNINEVMEFSIFGRGISGTLATKENKKSITAGLVDGNFNLFSPLPLGRHGYSAYAIAALGNQNTEKTLKANLLYRDSPYELSKHIMTGVERYLYINKDWNVNFQVHTALTNFNNGEQLKPSLSSSFQYSGRLNQFRLNGNYYFSTSYFPGNRRGNIQLQQIVNRQFENGANLWANVYFMHLSPKYLHYAYHSLSKNTLANIGYGFPKYRNLSFNIGYQAQLENSNTLSALLGEEFQAKGIAVSANRATFLLNWHSPNYKNLLSLNTETGYAEYSTEPAKAKFQTRLTSSYNYRWLNINATYQYGGFFLSEYIASLGTGQPFKRLALNATINHNFLNDKLSSNIGIGYSKDYIMGNTPSVMSNLKYFPNKKYSFFTNFSWYNYNLISMPARSLATIETGITRKFIDNHATSTRKAKVKVFLYLDRNGNNTYDRADIPAKNYFVGIGSSAFVTNNDGNAFYNMVPYGVYTINPISENGWFYDGGQIVINEKNETYQIPLRQMGSFYAQILYNYDDQRSVQFKSKASGITFIISQNNQVIKRINTDENGKTQEFLPSGHYQIELDVNTLPENTYCNQPIQVFEVSSGNITTLPSFYIEVKARKINIKRFGEG